MGFFTRLIAGLVAASTLGAGLAGTANAVETNGAASDTTGAVTTTADDTGGRTVLNCRQSGEGATGPYADKFCWIDWSNLPLDSSGKPTPVRINVPGGHIDADATITHTDNAALAAKDFTGSKWSRLTSAYKLTGNTALAFSGRMGRQDPAASVTFSNVTPSADRTDTGVNVLKDFRLAFGDAEVMSGGVLQGHDVYEQTDIESDKTLEKLGMIGSGDPNQSYSKANTGYGTTHVTLAGGPKGATDDANKDSKGAAVVGAKQASRFKVSFGQVNQHWDGWGSAIAVGVYMPYLTAYPLTYDKNASDAAGEVPSNQRGKENTTQPAKTKTNGTVKTVADTNASLPDHLVNGDFSVNYHDQWKDSFGGWTSIDPNTGKTLHVTNMDQDSNTWKWTGINGWNRSQFGWTSTQKAGGSIQQKANAVELQYDDAADNVYAELCAYEAGTAIYQDIRTVPGTLYKVRLKHASLNQNYLDKMQVLIGAPGHETPVEMTRTSVNGHGDKLNEKSTTIATKVTNGNNRHHADQWETYEGTYLIPDGQTTTRFTFRSIDAKQLDRGNVLDDIVFDKAYRLSYDKNASDASGQVPSNQRGKENTTQPAKDKTSGTVRLASDDDVVEYAANGLPKQIVNSDFDHDWQNIVSQSKMTGKYNFANVDPAHGDVEISGALNGKGEASKQWVHLNGFDAAKFGWKSNQTDTRVDGRGGIVEIQRSKANDNMYAEITASQANTYLYQDIDTAHSVPTVYTVKLRYAHRNGTVDSNEKIQILVGAPGHEQPVEMTRIASDRGNKVGEKSTTVNAPNTDGWLGSWDTFQGSVEIPAGQPVSRFTFKALGSIDGVTGNLIDDVQFKLAYPLSYDKNAQDAAGSVPSSQYGKENTVKPAEARATGTVKTVADDDSSKSLTVNPGFDVPDYSKLNDGGLHWMYVSPAEGKAWSFYDYINPAQPRHQVAGLSQATFGWQELTGNDHKTTSFELHREKDGNVCADVHGSRTIGQTIDTQAGVAYTVSIRHSGRSKGNAGSVQVLVGPDKDHLRPLEMSRMNVSRTGAKYGDRIGKVGTVITTHSDSVDSTEGDHPAWDHSDDWETYSGTYVATGGQTVFAYRGVDKNGNAVSGNDADADSVIDDLSFKLAYPLSYDKNAQDATGGVPSSQYGKENTVEPTKAKTTGRVGLAADKTASGLTVHDLKNGEIAPVQYGDFKFSTIDGVTADQITDVNGFTVKTNWNPTVENQAYAGTLLGTMYQPNKNGASLVLHHVGQWRDSSGTQRWLNAKITVNGQNLGSLVYYESQHKFLASYGKWDRHTSSRPYMDVTVDFLLDDGSTPQGLRGVTGFTDLDGGTSGYNEGVELVSGFDGAYVRSDAHLARFGTNGWAGATDENENNADAHGMKHYVGATFTGSSFRVRWSVASGQARGSGFQPVDSTIAYRLTYDKNAQDATGSIPSDTAANTTQPAKSETDGKVSDLVQRTTTHEDGSVTVRTVDQSTDVVSGCQVYYPAGQRITLATLAKDGDCWDSSMLTRPGHTQLGWSQDSQATQAQAEVTMVEGGMTVYAVWVGNPVLTYDTNKPNTWNGQMPSTPASVSVAPAGSLETRRRSEATDSSAGMRDRRMMRGRTTGTRC